MQLHYNTNGNLVLPKEHQDLNIRHGRNNRNNNCFNCHSTTNMEMLLTRDGRLLKIEQSTLLCANCHGPTYRDWEVGVHGRMSGFWNRSAGAVTRQDCVSCHDPHNPEFPSRKPAPGPHPLHPHAEAASEQAKHGVPIL
jgi:cytochrome c7-like protein